MASTKTVAFMGASTGIGLATLKHTLAAGHQCVALCRTPSKLTEILPPASNPNLRVIPGNAHDIDTVSELLRKDDGTLVDIVVSTIGNKPDLSGMINADPHVCGKAMGVLVAAVDKLRDGGAAGGPYIIACSTTGMSEFGRDIPVAMVPLYKVLLRGPHADKRVMQDHLTRSGYGYTIVQPSWLVNGETRREVRVGVEDPKTGPEAQAIGYTISREDAGRWFAENLVLDSNPRYLNKIAKITY